MSSKMGSRIKAYREDKELSLEDLAEKADCPHDLLVQVEAGEAEPELGHLVKLSRVLNVPLSTFMDDILCPDPYIIRGEETSAQVAKDVASNSSQRYYSLGKGKAGRGMEPFFITLGPCPDTPKVSSHDGEEFIVVVSGNVRLQYGPTCYELAPGDSAYYNSDFPHYVCAIGESATIYAVMHVPS